MQIGTATAELTQSLGRSPTPRELAEAIGCTVEEIVEGIESSNAYSTLSLDATDDSDDGSSSMLDAIGVDDEGLEHVEIRESLKPLLEQLGAAREEDPAAAVLQEHDAVADRRGDRRLPDARLPAADPHPRAAAHLARGARPRVARRRRQAGRSRVRVAHQRLDARRVQHRDQRDDRRERQGYGEQRGSRARSRRCRAGSAGSAAPGRAPSPHPGQRPGAGEQRGAVDAEEDRRPTPRPRPARDHVEQADDRQNDQADALDADEDGCDEQRRRGTGGVGRSRRPSLRGDPRSARRRRCDPTDHRKHLIPAPIVATVGSVREILHTHGLHARPQA